MDPRLKSKLLLDGFFPRQHPHTKSNVDQGFCLREPCSNCGEHEFIWMSIEFCPSCGYLADYWQQGNEEVEKFFRQYGQVKMEHEFLESAARDCLQELGLSEEDFSLTIHEDSPLFLNLSSKKHSDK